MQPNLFVCLCFAENDLCDYLHRRPRRHTCSRTWSVTRAALVPVGGVIALIHIDVTSVILANFFNV